LPFKRGVIAMNVRHNLVVSGLIVLGLISAATPAPADIGDEGLMALRQCGDRYTPDKAATARCFQQWGNMHSKDPERRDCAMLRGRENAEPADVDRCVEDQPREKIGPWSVHRTDAGEALKASASGSDGWILSLDCSRSSGLQATLTNLDPDYPYRVTAARAKTADAEQSVEIGADQATIVRGLIHLKGIDKLEGGLLRNEQIMIRLTRLGADDYTGDFNFSGTKAAASRIRETCPKF
jgi:hypothetical protein